MSAIILKIGSVDLSDITEQEGVDISTSPVFGAEFTSVTGKKRTKVLGESVSISASFNHLHEEKAAAIVNACKNDTVRLLYRFIR